VVWVKICSQFHLNLHFGFSESLDNIRFTDEEHFERDLPLSQEIRFLLIFFLLFISYSYPLCGIFFYGRTSF